jgi:outer membrane protein OmpA-like peptidoglycan-associated protein
MAMLWLSVMALPVSALTLTLPQDASLTGQRQISPTSFRMPIGPFADGQLPTRTSEGALDQSAWRINRPGLTTLAVLEPLRRQIDQWGYHILYECEAIECGGFDFRYGTDVLPEPEMHVDLGEFRYLAAERITPAGTEVISLLVSRSADQSFVQVTRVTPKPEASIAAPAKGDPSTRPASATAPPAAAYPRPAARAAAAASAPVSPVSSGSSGSSAAPSIGTTDLGTAFKTHGAVALDDLIFASGAAALAPGDYSSLTQLAAWLHADPARKLILVGHTDTSGQLDANMALSLRRASSVRETLISSLHVPADQIIAKGAGPLSPRTENLSATGREKNRRVEAVLLP